MGSKGTGKAENPGEFRKIRVLLEEIREENACVSLKDLAVNGRDLMAMGYRGKAIGNALNALLDLVLDEQVENQREALLAKLESLHMEKGQ